MQVELLSGFGVCVAGVESIKKMRCVIESQPELQVLFLRKRNWNELEFLGS